MTVTEQPWNTMEPIPLINKKCKLKKLKKNKYLNEKKHKTNETIKQIKNEDIYWSLKTKVKQQKSGTFR